MFRIGGNTFYNQKNKILMKILEFKRSGIGIIAEFRGIPRGFSNQAIRCDIEASHRHPSGVTSRHRTTIRHDIKTSRCQPLGATSSIAPPSGAKSRHCTAIRSNIEALCRQPLGTTSRHCATIRRDIKALRSQPSGTASSIAPPSGAKLRHCAAIRILKPCTISHRG